MRFDIEEFRKKSRSDFDQAWHEGPSVLTPPAGRDRYPRLSYRRASAHPVFETVNRLRETYLSLGFDEACNPLIVEEQDIYRQFGPEAAAVLDRVFYLGGLPRPNVGIGKQQLSGIALITGREVTVMKRRSSGRPSMRIKSQRSMATSSYMRSPVCSRLMMPSSSGSLTVSSRNSAISPLNHREARSEAT